MSTQAFPAQAAVSESSRERSEEARLDTLARVIQPDPVFLAVNLNLKKTKPLQWWFKRQVDVWGSITGLLLLSPLLLLVALAIWLESPGPVIYRQTRYGLRGRTFEMYKFRSMRLDAEKELESLLPQNQTNGGMFKMFNDPRVTRVGRFIRRYSIDELPQLLNVLKGDMSLVGPRPPIEREVRQYKSWHYLRFATLPGLTGVWQVSGRSRVQEFDEVVKMDFQYISQWNLLLDFKLILKTFPVVLGGMDTA